MRSRKVGHRPPSPFLFEVTQDTLFSIAENSWDACEMSLSGAAHTRLRIPGFPRGLVTWAHPIVATGTQDPKGERRYVSNLDVCTKQSWVVLLSNVPSIRTYTTSSISSKKKIQRAAFPGVGKGSILVPGSSRDIQRLSNQTY